jgi:hypothetical protein
LDPIVHLARLIAKKDLFFGLKLVQQIAIVPFENFNIVRPRLFKFFQSTPKSAKRLFLGGK